MAAVELQGVTKDYPNAVRAVDNVNLAIADGELMVMVGPSGCGKTTVLRLIAGLEECTKGTIRIGDRAVNGVDPKDRDLAMVFQNYALYPHLNIFDNMAFGLKLRRRSRTEIHQRVNEAAESLGLSDLLKRRPHELSGGQQQRVALARAIVRRPSVFMFDEPLSNLDFNLRVQMRVEIQRLHQSLGQTMIYVTHDQTEAMTMADRIVVMKDGVIQQIDEPKTVYDRPANAFVAGCIGIPPMNQLNGQILRQEDEYFFQSDSLTFPIPLHSQPTAVEFKNRQVIFGIRPDDVELTKHGVGSFPATIDLIEPTGSDTFLHLNLKCIDRRNFVVRVQGQRTFDIGQKIHIRIDMSRARFFDGESQSIIL